MMNGQYRWVNRQAMVKRGILIIEAHWHGWLDQEDLDRWFTRHINRYAAWHMGRNLTDNTTTVAKRFWYDVIVIAEKRAGL